MSQLPFTNNPDTSVGIVSPQQLDFDGPFLLTCGRSIPGFKLMVETYGDLNQEASNAILICHALGGNHHAAGFHDEEDQKPGWWDNYIGPGKPIDTNHFFVVCPNNIGGCHGSTGPNTINPATDEPWGPEFPPLRARDWVNAQALLADRLGIDQWAAVIGGSLGGMQVMRWALEYPNRIRHAIVIASTMKLTAQNIAFNELARNAIKSDPDFCDGYFLREGKTPRNGLALARMIGHVTYLSDEMMGVKFGRELRSGSFQRGLDTPVEFQVESYLRYQGDRFSGSFDANSYILITKILDYFDLAREYQDDPVKAFSHATCSFLVVSFTSDWRFPPLRSREIVNALVAANKRVNYVEIESTQGHDAFLLPNERYWQALNIYLTRVRSELATASSESTT